jgi:hypothetical protein
MFTTFKTGFIIEQKQSIHNQCLQLIRAKLS